MTNLARTTAGTVLRSSRPRAFRGRLPQGAHPRARRTEKGAGALRVAAIGGAASSAPRTPSFDRAIGARESAVRSSFPLGVEQRALPEKDPRGACADQRSDDEEPQLGNAPGLRQIRPEPGRSSAPD